MTYLRNILWPAAFILVTFSSRTMADEQALPQLSSDLGLSLIKLVGALIFILAVIYGSVWLMKRFSVGRMVGGGELISVVDKRYLAPKQVIFLVKVGRKHLLVGSSEAGLTRIAEIEHDDISDHAANAVAHVQTSKFNQVLKQAKESFLPLLRSKGEKVEMET